MEITDIKGIVVETGTQQCSQPRLITIDTLLALLNVSSTFPGTPVNSVGSTATLGVDDSEITYLCDYEKNGYTFNHTVDAELETAYVEVNNTTLTLYATETLTVAEAILLINDVTADVWIATTQGNGTGLITEGTVVSSGGVQGTPGILGRLAINDTDDVYMAFTHDPTTTQDDWRKILPVTP